MSKLNTLAPNSNSNLHNKINRYQSESENSKNKMNTNIKSKYVVDSNMNVVERKVDDYNKYKDIDLNNYLTYEFEDNYSCDDKLVTIPIDKTNIIKTQVKSKARAKMNEFNNENKAEKDNETILISTPRVQNIEFDLFNQNSHK